MEEALNTEWKTDEELIGQLDGNQELFEKWVHEGRLRANPDGLYAFEQFKSLRAAINQTNMRHLVARAVRFTNPPATNN